VEIEELLQEVLLNVPGFYNMRITTAYSLISFTDCGSIGYIPELHPPLSEHNLSSLYNTLTGMSTSDTTLIKQEIQIRIGMIRWAIQLFAERLERRGDGNRLYKLVGTDQDPNAGAKIWIELNTNFPAKGEIDGGT
jgi:hypothetical protein